MCGFPGFRVNLEGQGNLVHGLRIGVAGIITWLLGVIRSCKKSP